MKNYLTIKMNKLLKHTTQRYLTDIQNEESYTQKSAYYGISFI